VILAAAVIVGLLASLAFYRRRVFSQIAAIPLRSAWLVSLAIVLQLPLLRAPAGTAQDLRVQQALFLASYLLLLVFIWRNRGLAAILIVGTGILCNLLVIVVNGGFMPITPETLARINPGSSVEQWPEQVRYGYSKDIIHAQERTKLWALSDTLIVPPPFPWPTAFSVGDLIIALGIVALLLAPQRMLKRRTDHES
jgi:hypothetical protein